MSLKWFNSERARRVWAIVVPIVLVAACITVAGLADPPPKLEEWIGDKSWARAAVAFSLFIAAYAVAITLGVVAGTIGLPGGITVERGSRTGAEAGDVARLAEAHDRLLIRMGEMQAILQGGLEQLARLEDRAAALERERRPRGGTPDA